MKHKNIYKLEVTEEAQETLSALRRALTVSERQDLEKRVVRLCVDPYSGTVEWPDEGCFTLEHGRVIMVFKVSEDSKRVSIINIEFEDGIPKTKNRGKAFLRLMKAVGLATGVLGGILKIIETVVALVPHGGLT